MDKLNQSFWTLCALVTLSANGLQSMAQTAPGSEQSLKATVTDVTHRFSRRAVAPPRDANTTEISQTADATNQDKNFSAANLKITESSGQEVEVTEQTKTITTQQTQLKESVQVSGNDRPKIALALGGGGTRGVAHVGVLRVLVREHIPIDCIAGTSIGAIVGGLFSAGLTTEQIQTQLLNSRLLHAYQTVPIPFRVAIIPISVIPRLLGSHPYEGLYRGNKFRNFLLKQIPESSHNIEELKTPFVAVCSNLIDARAVAVNKGNLGKAIQASSAIPFLRQPVQYGNDQLLVDGALEANLPVQQARDLIGTQRHRHRCQR